MQLISLFSSELLDHSTVSGTHQQRDHVSVSFEWMCGWLDDDFWRGQLGISEELTNQVRLA